MWLIQRIRLSIGGPHKGLGIGVRLSRLLALCVLLGAPLAAADVASGQFVVQSAQATQRDGVYYVTAEIGYGLTDAAIEALTRGVPLTFEVQIDVARTRRYLPDANLAELRQRYALSYHALTERYVVRNINSGEQGSYSTLSTALRALGRIEDLPVIDSNLLREDADYTISLRSTLDLKSFPGPLRLLATLFRFNDWRLASKWHTWPLNP